MTDVTKSNVAAVVASVDGPLAFISWSLIPYKLCLQELRLHKLSWDETRPNELLEKWQQLNSVGRIEIDRLLWLKEAINLQVRGFADVSEPVFICGQLIIGRWSRIVNCKRGEENDSTESFIALIICSTCFGHLYANHQEFETVLVLLSHMVCNALVDGGRLLGAEQQAMRHPGHIACCTAPNSRPPTTKALHTICGNNTSIVWSSWWWAYKCSKHVE